MKKSAKELAELAFVFAKNMIERKKSVIENPDATDEEKADAMAAIAEFENLEKDFNDQKHFCSIKNFSAENPEDISNHDVKVFAILRKYLSMITDEQDIDLDDQLTELAEKLVEIEVNPNVLTCIVNHIAKIKGLEYNEEDDLCYQKYDELADADPEMVEEVDSMIVESTNIMDILQTFDKTVIKFAGGEGLDMLESGVKFLEQIAERKRSAENPDMIQIAEYDKAINGVKQYVESKKFSADESFIPEGFEEKEISDIVVKSYQKDDHELVIYFKGDEIMKVELDGEVIDKSQILEKLNPSPSEVEIDIDAETGEIISK